MRALFAAALSLAAAACFAQEQEIQRALIQRDQQSAEFAAGVRASTDLGRLQVLHAQQLREAAMPLDRDPPIARQLHPYQRQKMADERALVLPPPVTMVKLPEKPLPLPGGPRHGVDPIPAQGPGY